MSVGFFGTLTILTYLSVSLMTAIILLEGLNAYYEAGNLSEVSTISQLLHVRRRLMLPVYRLRKQKRAGGNLKYVMDMEKEMASEAENGTIAERAATVFTTFDEKVAELSIDSEKLFEESKDMHMQRKDRVQALFQEGTHALKACMIERQAPTAARRRRMSNTDIVKRLSTSSQFDSLAKPIGNLFLQACWEAVKLAHVQYPDETDVETESQGRRKRALMRVYIMLHYLPTKQTIKAKWPLSGDSALHVSKLKESIAQPSSDHGC